MGAWDGVNTSLLSHSDNMKRRWSGVDGVSSSTLYIARTSSHVGESETSGLTLVELLSALELEK